MKKFFSKKNVIIMAISLIVILIAVAFAMIFPPLRDTNNAAMVSKGVTCCGVYVGEKVETEVSALLDEKIGNSKEITIKTSEKEITLDLNTAGFSIDKEKMLAEIMSVGKNNLSENFAVRRNGYDVPVRVVADQEKFTEVVDALLNQDGYVEQRFDYSVNGDVAEIVLFDGSTIYDISQLYAEIAAQYPDVQAEYSLLERPAPSLTVEDILEGINIPVMDARIDQQDGRKVIVPHQIGLTVDEEALAEKLASGEKEFSVPVIVLKPKVYTDDLSADAFPNRLATYSTKYNEGEVSRSSNVKLAAKKVNGTVLNSGEVFSFNQVVGKRSYENGFKDAKIFLSDKVVDGTGGGICQVSSTIYPAVLYSDLKIVERLNHNFVVSYAKSGIDATVVYGSIDFKFENSMQNPIKMKAIAENGVMTVEIWGTKENNNTVEITTEHLGSYGRGVKYEYNPNLEPGKTVVTQAGYDGLKVRAYRIVRDENGAVIRTDDLGVSNYIPLVKIVQTWDKGLVETGVASELPTEEGSEAIEGEEGVVPDTGEGETTEPEEGAEQGTTEGENLEVTPETNPEVTPGTNPDVTLEVTPEEVPSTEDSQEPVTESSPITTPAPTAAPDDTQGEPEV